MRSIGLRPLILGLLLASLPGCSPTQSGAPAQANVAAASADEVAPDEVAPAEGAPVVLDPNGNVDRSHKGEAPPPVVFESPAGQSVGIGDLIAGPTLVNLWATWCAPCVAELPTLDALAAQGRGRLLILAVSQDLDGAAKVQPFLAQRGVEALEPYRDPKAGLSVAYGVNLPTTILYGRDGREIWRITGGMDWTGGAARALIAEAG